MRPQRIRFDYCSIVESNSFVSSTSQSEKQSLQRSVLSSLFCAVIAALKKEPLCVGARLITSSLTTMPFLQPMFCVIMEILPAWEWRPKKCFASVSLVSTVSLPPRHLPLFWLVSPAKTFLKVLHFKSGSLNDSWECLHWSKMERELASALDEVRTERVGLSERPRNLIEWSSFTRSSKCDFANIRKSVKSVNIRRVQVWLSADFGEVWEGKVGTTKSEHSFKLLLHRFLAIFLTASNLSYEKHQKSHNNCWKTSDSLILQENRKKNEPDVHFINHISYPIWLKHLKWCNIIILSTFLPPGEKKVGMDRMDSNWRSPSLTWAYRFSPINW